MVNHEFNRVDIIEKQCVCIIDEHLDIFFNACRKSAFGYSMMISKDLKAFNIETFESMVISEQEMASYIATITKKLNYELENYFGFLVNLEGSCDCNESLVEAQMVLKETIESFSITQRLTKGCEKIMKFVFNKTINSLFPYKPLHLAAKKLNIADRVLGPNSSKGQISGYQAEIFNQIQGMLLNIKLDIRNYMLEEVYKSISFISQSSKRINNALIA